jgi:hypothetical protein
MRSDRTPSPVKVRGGDFAAWLKLIVVTAEKVAILRQTQPELQSLQRLEQSMSRLQEAVSRLKAIKKNT